MTQNHVIVVFTLIVFSGGEIPVESVNFPSFLCVWKHPWSRVSKCHLLFSFPFIAFHVAFISSHVPFMLHSLPFILLSCPFMFCRYVSKIQAFKSWYAQPVRWVSAQTLAFVFRILLSFLLSFVYGFGGLCRLPSSGFLNMYRLVVVFLLLSFSGPATHWQC